MKIVLIGAASYVFGPTVLLDAIARHRMEGELVLVDLSLEAAEAMAGVGRRMADDLGVNCTVTATDVRRGVLQDADYVILSAAPEGRRRWLMDYDLLKQYGMPDQARECAGLGGMSYALRTISMALDLCEDMADLCPNAALLDVTNPMPRLVSAVNRFTDVRAYGFCNVAFGGENGYEWLAGLVGRPYQNLDVVTAGLNHFAWLISIHDHETGENLYGDVVQAICEGEGQEFVLLRQWLDVYGAVGVSSPNHMAEFLPYSPDAHYASSPPYHGNAEERTIRLRTLHAISDGVLDWKGSFSGGSWEHPVDVAVALSSGTSLAFEMLNLPNRGYLTDIPDGRIVEVPVRIAGGEIRGVQIGALPGNVGEVCRMISDVHALVAEGGATGDRRCLVEAIAMDPAIIDKQAALLVLDDLLALHRDLLPRFRAPS